MIGTTSTLLKVHLVTVLCLLMLSACASTPRQTATSSDRDSNAARYAQQTPSQLIAESRRLQYPLAADVLLLAARKAADVKRLGELDLALQRLRSLPLNASHRYRSQVAEVELLLLKQQSAAALQQANALGVAPDSMGDLAAASVYAEVYAQLDQPFASAQALIRVLSRVPDEERASAAEMIWRQLNRLPVAELQRLQGESLDEAESAWAALALVHRGWNSLDEQMLQYRNWQQRHARWISERDIPLAMRELPTLVQTRPATVALLLPFSGPLAAAGGAVRDGFMAALLSTSGIRPKVLLIDSSTDVVGAYLEALSAQADVVVGPLDKQQLTRLNDRSELRIPTLALNYLAPGVQATTQLYQFGLAPEDEAREVAQRLHREGRLSVLLVRINADWSTRAAYEFEHAYAALGGRVAERFTYSSGDDADLLVRNSLLIAQPAMLSDALETLEKTPQPPPRYLRTDLDAIVLLTTASEGLRLQRAVTTYAPSLVTYATSNIYSGQNASSLRDLQGIRFCDTPWRLDFSALRNEVNSAWPQSRGNAGNLYALGIDAFRLHGRLAQLQHGQIQGVTGVLSLDPDGSRIGRRLAWGSFAAAGEIQLLPEI